MKLIYLIEYDTTCTGKNTMHIRASSGPDAARQFELDHMSQETISFTIYEPFETYIVDRMVKLI